jgi:hypothetical protein
MTVFGLQCVRRYLNWVDEEKVFKICLIDSIFLGDGSIPQTPLLGGKPSVFANRKFAWANA